MRRVIGPVRTATRKVQQLTGERDRERGVPTASRTETEAGIFGTDLGASFEHDGRLWFLFGDTVSSVGYTDLRPDAGDSIAWTTDTDPEGPVRLQFLRGPDGRWISPRVPPVLPAGNRADDNSFNVPLDGFSHGGRMYMYFTTNADKSGPRPLMGRSWLGRLVDEGHALFEVVHEFSDFKAGGKFVNISCSVVDNATVPGLPRSSGLGLVLFGGGNYRGSNVFLAWLPLGPDTVGDKAEARFWRDGPDPWSPLEADAKALFDQPQVGELSVRFVLEIGAWVMLYNAENPRGITMRWAAQPTGPWSAGQVVFEPYADGGYGHFMHLSWTEGHADAVHDDGRAFEGGGEYGPYLVSRFTRTDQGELVLYWVMSTWNPYNTVLMRSRIRLDPWRGWYSLDGVAFAPGAKLAALSRGPKQLEVWAVDTSNALRGNWFDEAGWHGWYALDGAAFPPGAGVAAVSRDKDRLEVWAVDLHNGVRGNWFDGAGWHGWYSLGGASSPAGGGVAAVSRGPKQLEVWSVDGDGRMRGNWFDEAGWHGWYALDGATFPPGAGVAAVSRDKDRLEVWAVDTDGRLRGNWFDEGGWHGWYALDGAAFPPGAAIAAVSRGPKQLEVWAVGHDGTVRGDWYDEA
jgi:hypothetical protein